MANFLIVDPSRPLVIGPITAGSVPPPQGAGGTQSVTTAGAGTFTWPAGVGSVRVECWGGGGGGGGGAAAAPAGGGGGGAYAVKIVQGVPGTLYPYVVGAAGAGGVADADGQVGTSGGDTTFRATVVVADAGKAGVTFDVGGAGGLASASTGTSKFNGGAGADDATTAGGGGGSSAAPDTDGNPASGDTGGAAPPGGGGGGFGGTSAAGAAGSIPGSGGGGGDDTFAGGAGRPGKIRFTW